MYRPGRVIDASPKAETVLGPEIAEQDDPRASARRRGQDAGQRPFRHVHPDGTVDPARGRRTLVLKRLRWLHQPWRGPGRVEPLVDPPVFGPQLVDATAGVQGSFAPREVHDLGPVGVGECLHHPRLDGDRLAGSDRMSRAVAGFERPALDHQGEQGGIVRKYGHRRRVRVRNLPRLSRSSVFDFAVFVEIRVEAVDG